VDRSRTQCHTTPEQRRGAAVARADAQRAGGTQAEADPTGNAGVRTGYRPRRRGAGWRVRAGADLTSARSRHRNGGENGGSF
jgi:hypothetical protein